MILDWTRQALDDVARLEAFLADVAPTAALAVRNRLFAAPDRLLQFPRIGAPAPGYAPREVRKLFVGKYELRYEILPGIVRILNIWHTREERPFGPTD